MRNLVLYESFEASQISIQKTTLARNLKILGKLVTYPDILKKSPETWLSIVGYGEQPEETIPGLNYTLDQLRDMAQNVKLEVWGTPQAFFDNFYSLIRFKHGVYLDAGEFDDIDDYSLSDYMQAFGKSKEISKMMMDTYNGYESVEWIPVK